MAADLEQTQAIFFDEFDDETDDEDAASKGPVSHLKVISTADFPEKVFPLHEGNNVIGRQEGVCDICIPLKGLSREHACIQIQGDSHLIYDKGSRNKTRRGKLFLSPDVRYELKHNDQLIFGDVGCVYLIENQKGDSGSETGSESMFQTAPSDALGAAQKQGVMEGTMVIEEEGYESDESVDLLQTTQAYVSNSTATLKIAPDSDDDDDDEDVKKNHNITVKDTPAPTRLKGISTLVLPESDSETDDEEQKKLKSNDIQTLYIEETQKDDSADGDILYAATQACHVTESDDETDDEESNDLHKDILTAATQAFTDIDTKKDETEDSSDMPTQSFVAESDDEKDRTKNKLVVKEIEITDDESTDDEDGVGPDVSHLFANPTLACDMEDYNDEDDQNKRCGMDEPTQAFSGDDAPTQTFENVSQSSQQGKKEETLVIHEGETLAVEDVTTARKIPKADTVVTGDDATQVFGGDETVAIDESPVSKKALSPHIKSKDDDATQVFSGDEDQTMAITDSPVSKKVMSPHVKSKDDDATQVFSGDEDQTMAITESPVSKKGENTPKGLSPNLKSKDKDPTQVFSGVDDQTLAITESPVSNKQVMIQNKEPEVEDATLAISNISEDATMAVSDEILPTVKQNRRGRRNAKKPQTEPDDNIDATLDVNNITSDATVAVSDDTPTENKTQQSKQMSRGRRSGRNVKSDNSITGDATVAVSEETQADSDTETKQLKTSRRGKKKSVVSSNTVDASVVSSDTVDATVAITDDTMPASEIDVVQDKKGKKNVRKSHKKEADATQEFDLTSTVNSDDAKMTEGAGVGNNDATQVFEKTTGSSVKKDNIDETNSNVQFENVSNDDTQTFTGNATIPVSELDQVKPSPPRGRSSRNKVKEENKSTETAKTRKKPGKHQDKDTSNDATQAFDNDGATQVFDLDVTEDVAEDNKCKKGGKSKKSGGKLSSRTKDDVSEMPEEETADVSLKVEATQVYAMEVEDDDDATPIIEPTQPYCMEDDGKAAHINIEPTQPYCLEEEMAPQDEESVPDSEERHKVLRSPVVPLPPTSPHKSVLASPNRRQQKSPSPKRVKFDVKKGMSENSEEIGSEPSTSNVDTDRKISTRGTRGKVDTSVESTSKASKKGKKTEPQEETTPALTKSTRGRRSAQAEIQKQDEEKITKKSRKSLPAVSQKTEEEKTTRRGGRRSVPAVMERNVEENKVESSEVKTRGKRGKTKVSEDVDEKNEDKNVTENEAENSSKTEKVETKPAKKARGKVSVETVSQNEKGDHVDVEDTSSETVTNNKDKDVHIEHQKNESESKTEGKPTNKRTKGKRGKLKNISEESDKTDNEPVPVTDISTCNSVADNTEEVPHPSTSTTEDEQVNTGRKKRGHTSAIHPTDNKSSEPTSNSVVEDDKKQSEGSGRTRRGRDSAIKKDETSSKENDKSTQNKEEKSDSHPSVRSKSRRGRESEPVESVEVKVDNSVVEQSVIHKSGKRGKKSENVESKNEQNDVPPDTLAKLKRTGKNKPGNSDVTINDDSVHESVSNESKKRKAITDDKTDSQESDTKTRSKRRKVTENSEDNQESDTKARSKRRTVTENSDDSQAVKSKAGGKRKTMDQDVTLVEESTSKNNRKRGKEIENDVTQSPSSRKPTNTLTVSSPSLRRKSMEPKPKVLFTGVVDEQGQKIVKELGGELVSSVYDCTHLVTDKVRRTLKFLCCLSRGIPIVKPTWLENCNQSKRFIDYTPYLVQDTAAEKQYNFSLRKSIEKASETSVLDGYKIHVTKSVKPDPPQMEDIIKCSGGEYLKTLPKKSSDNTIVISCPDDKPHCEAALKADIPVVNAEFILTGILRQEADVNAYRIFTEGNSSRKRGADSLAGGPSKRRR